MTTTTTMKKAYENLKKEIMEVKDMSKYTINYDKMIARTNALYCGLGAWAAWSIGKRGLKGHLKTAYNKPMQKFLLGALLEGAVILSCVEEKKAEHKETKTVKHDTNTEVADVFEDLTEEQGEQSYGEYWMVIAKDTDMGDVEVWHGDYEDCVEFFDGNDGMLNGAFLEIVPDVDIEELMKESDKFSNDINEVKELVKECNALLERLKEPFVYDCDDDDDLEELPFN